MERCTTESGENYRSWGNEGYYKGKKHCGQGTYKEVYQAKHYPSNQVVALAKVRYHYPREAMITMREIANHALFSHLEHVMPLITTFSYLSEKHKIFRAIFVMPLCFSDLEKADLSPMVKTQLLFDVCKGISKIHEAGHVIGDLKRNNIMLEKRRNSEGVEYIHPLLGDLAGMFPEDNPPSSEDMISSWTNSSIEGLRYRFEIEPIPEVKRSHDMWSVAIMLYECWTNEMFPLSQEFCFYAIKCLNAKAINIMPKMIEGFKATFTTDKVVSDLIKQNLSLVPEERSTIDHFMSVLQPVLYPPTEVVVADEF